MVRTSFADPVAFAVLPWQRGFEERQGSGWRGATGVEFASQDGASSDRKQQRAGPPAGSAAAVVVVVAVAAVAAVAVAVAVDVVDGAAAANLLPGALVGSLTVVAAAAS